MKTESMFHAVLLGIVLAVCVAALLGGCALDEAEGHATCYSGGQVIIDSDFYSYRESFTKEDCLVFELEFEEITVCRAECLISYANDQKEIQNFDDRELLEASK